jgi:hypothetical protein
MAARNASGLRVGDLGGVDRAVDEVEDAVPLEDPVVVPPRPDRVAQHADPDPPLAQPPEHPRDVGVGVRVRLPELLVHLLRTRVVRVVGGDADRLEQLLERGAAAVAPDPLPGHPLGLEHALDQRLATVRVVGVVPGVLAGVGPPLLGHVDRVPGRQRAAPVEDDGIDGTAPVGGTSHGISRGRAR